MHDIKKPINELISKKIKQSGLNDYSENGIHTTQQSNEKPTLLVVLEWFSSSHSIYRTHSRTIEGARQHFRVIGMAYEHCLDDISRQVFDEFIPIDHHKGIIEQLSDISQVAKNKQASICYMPSVGMFPLTMWLSNLRVAPLQMMALGHPATTHAHAIDYVVVEEDYIGDTTCFSEQLLVLPKDGMPYRPSESAKTIHFTDTKKLSPDRIQIAVCATTMKLNPGFLSACARIIHQAKVPIFFRFLIGQAQGLVYPHVKRVVHQFLGDNVQVYPHQDYASYMAVINECDMFINPFPFGNTNGIIDTVSAGLIGVCKTGREVHEHIDEGIFKRLGLPEWLVTHSVEEYIQATIKLAQDHQERLRLSQLHAGIDKIDVMFQGRPEILGNLMKQKVRNIENI